MEKIKILIACHKPAEVPHDEVYTPLHVGKALHPECDLGFAGDDTGDNISLKNASYCELTAQYWGWKNTECEYIGLAHYRRFFEERFTAENTERLMDGHDVVLASPLHFQCSVDQFWMSKLIPEDVTILYLILQRYYPVEFQYAQKYLTGNMFYPCNMFVCRKTLFDDFATWQFDVLSRVEQALPLSSYSRERRIMGFLGEALLPIWFLAHGYSVKTMHIVDRLGKRAIPHMKTRLKWRVINWRIDMNFRKKSNPYLYIGDDYIDGLRQDGILRKIDLLAPPAIRLDNAEHHILCLGNSITFHPRKDSIGWHSAHGMAASSPSADFCHRLETALQAHNPHSSVVGINIADWETNFHANVKRMTGNSLYGNDVIIIRLGENVRDTKHFRKALCRLVRLCRQHTGRVILCGCVWKDTAKERAIVEAASRCGVDYVALDWIMSQHPDTYPHVGDTLFDTDGKPYTIETPFITTHPNDLGMQMIADAILRAIQPSQV